MANTRRPTLLVLSFVLLVIPIRAQHIAGYNYDESKIPPYTMLDPLRLTDGHTVTSPQQWFDTRRPEIARLFEGDVFGRTPAAAQNAVTHARTIEHNEKTSRAVAAGC
jgi:hypothetical protein